MRNKYFSKFRYLSFYLLLITGIVFLSFLGLFSFAQENFVYNAKGKHNPFIPLITAEGRLLKLDSEQGGETVLKVEGIMYDKNNNSYAIVNGKIVRKGDTVAECEILEIEETKVIYAKNGKKSEVELEKEAEK